MDPAHNFGQIRLHLSRALFHLNHLATLLSSLNFQDLSVLGTVMAITAHRLARQADPNTPAHEVALPPTSDEGL